MNSGFKVLLVDDDADIRWAIANILKKCECDVYDAVSVEVAFSMLAEKHYDAVFCDMRFQGELGGEDLLEHIIANYPDIPVVLVSSSMTSSQKSKLCLKGAAHCLQKPFFRDTCLTVLSNLGYKVPKIA